MARPSTQQGTWVIEPSVRRILARTVLELRTALKDDFTRQLYAIGIHEEGSHALPAGRTLSDYEEHLHKIAIAVIGREVEGGSTEAQAFETYVRDSAYTFLNRMVGLRCLEERRLLFVDGQTETVVKTDPARNASSLYWRVRNEMGPQAQPREVWRESLRRAGAATSERVKVLFDPDSEYAALLPLQPALQRVVEALNSAAIPSGVYAEDEFLGWIYQYYNASEKDATYARLAKGKKLEQPSELIAATCLYTERYMVDYLLQNTLGTLWVEMHPASGLPDRWPYFVRPPEGQASVRPVRPLREITVLDPACGSGHFLVRAFDLLVQMYREEGLEPENEIPHLIIERNLHGIDIDLRAVQIAALGLFLKACALAGPSFQPRRLNLVAADALLPGDEPTAEYMAKLNADPLATAVVKGIWLGLRNVREIGSLLHPERALEEVIRRQRQSDPLHLRDDVYWEQWKTELLQGLGAEFERQARSEDLGQRLFGKEAAKGIGLVEALGRKHDVVVTNPPYAGAKNLNSRVKGFIEREYKDGKHDLYATFIERCQSFSGRGGCVGMVTQQSWLFLRSFAALRKAVLKQGTVLTLGHLGPRAFEEISGEIVNTVLITVHVEPHAPDHQIVALRLVGARSAEEKELLLRRTAQQGSRSRYSIKQSKLASLPMTPFCYWIGDHLLEIMAEGPHARDFVSIRQGTQTADNDRFVRSFWEVEANSKHRWFPFAKGGGYRKWAGNADLLVDWEDSGARIKSYIADRYPYLHGNWGMVVRNERFYGDPGATFSQMSGGSLGVRMMESGWIFSAKGPAVFPLAEHELEFISAVAVLNSRVVSYALRGLSGSMDFTESCVQAAPFPRNFPAKLDHLVELYVQAKGLLTAAIPTERSFHRVWFERVQKFPGAKSANEWISIKEDTAAVLHSVEGLLEATIFEAYGLGDGEALNRPGFSRDSYP